MWSISWFHILYVPSCVVLAVVTVSPYAHVLTLHFSVLPFSNGPWYGCSSVRWSGSGPVVECDNGTVRGSARIPPEMPSSPRRHHWFLISAHRRLPPWQLQASQTGWVHIHMHTPRHRSTFFLFIYFFYSFSLLYIFNIFSPFYYHTTIYIIPYISFS